MRTIEGLENKKIGKLLVVKKVGKKWECECDCGKICYYPANYLNSSHASSCGCKKKPNLIGKKFGRLTVMSAFGINKNGHKIWNCKCDCGKLRTAIGTKLVNGRTQSCGCKKREETIKRQWKGYGEISGSFWTRIVNQAKIRNFEVNVTIEDIWNLFLKQEKKCKLTSLPLNFSSSYWATNGTASLDRINSKLGYIDGNIQWIHKDVNQMKMDLDEKYFIELCKKIVKTDKKKGCSNE